MKMKDACFLTANAQAVMPDHSRQIKVIETMDYLLIRLFNDIGRERVTGLTEDNRKFKVPSLRNIETTSPYMHDGRIANTRRRLGFLYRWYGR